MVSSKNTEVNKFKIKNKNGSHPCKILNNNGERVRIDAQIAKFINLCWKLGIKTIGSCQDHCSFRCIHKWKKQKFKDGTAHYEKIITKKCHKHIWVVFESHEDYCRLLNTVAVYEKAERGKLSMYDLMSGVGENDRWDTLMTMANDGVKYQWKKICGGEVNNFKRFLARCDVGCGKNNFKVEIQLTFPQKHLALVEERLQQAVSKLSSKRK